MLLRTASIAGAALAVLASPALGWGPDGHRIIAELAEHELTPRTRAEVGKLLGPHTSLADVSSYADEYRARCKNTGPWHYVNIPLAATAYDAARMCSEARGGCVLAALERELRILRDRAQVADERAFALRFVVHLVGDLHQPLHCGDNADRGGNDRPLRFLGADTNLHRLWDLELIRATRRTPRDYVRTLRGLGLQQAKRTLQRAGALDWAMEARDVARRFAYGKLPVGSDAGELGEAYLRAVIDALELQLLRAGLRLARVLNEAFASPGTAVETESIAAHRLCTP